MELIPEKVYKAVTASNISDVVFNDPLGDEARKAKRNLVAGSFVAIVVAVFEVQVSSFAGLSVQSANLSSLLVQGLACAAVLYFFAAFVVALFVDYAAWKFKLERYLVEPYLDLVRLLEGRLRTWPEQLGNAEAEMNNHVAKNPALSNAYLQMFVGHVNSIRKGQEQLQQELEPLLRSWADNVRRAERLTWRYRVRYAGFALLDVFVPLALGITAVVRTADGFVALMFRVFS